MKRTPLLCLLFLLNTVVGFTQSDTLYRSIVQDGLQREYLLYVPEAYDGTEEWPLVLNFHAYSTSAFNQMVVSDMNPVADTGRFLIAYPLGTELFSTVPNTPEQGLGFNIVSPTDTGFTSTFSTDDVAFTSQIIDEIAADYTVDLSRVYATGWSNGGFFSTILANELSDRIAAIAPVGGTLPRSKFIDTSTPIPTLFDPDRPVPALYVYGTEDGVAPYRGSDFMLSADEILAVWAASNGCDAAPTVTRLPDLSEADSTTTDLIAWENCEAPVQHLRVNGGGHQWFGGPNLFPFLGNVSADIHASTEIWRFFKQFSLPKSEGQVLEKTMMVDGLEREYLLYLPEGYITGEELPLVLHFHGFGINAQTQMELARMNEVADTGRFIIAYPQGTIVKMNAPGTPSEGPGFNVSYPGDTSLFITEVDDVSFVDQLIDELDRHYNIDLTRVYATGWSNGGNMSHVLACELSDRIAAIAPVAGTAFFRRECPNPRSLPILQIHGTMDPIIDYDLGNVSQTGDISGVGAYLDYWLASNNCEGEPTVTMLPDLTDSDSSTVELQVWEGCEQEVRHFKVLNGGHQWPGGINLFPFVGNFNLDFSASAEIWKFFSRHSLPMNETQLLAKTVEVAGLEREYRLYVPPSYDASEETPLVFVYHGGNTPVEAQIDISIMNPVADTAGFIIAYPVGLPVFDSIFNQVSPSWTYPGIVAEHDDVAFTRQMINTISGEYNINADRIYATGWSAGSEFAFHLACELPNQIAAIAGVGGQMSNLSVAACDTSERLMPVLQMHGTADVILPFDGAGVYPAAISSAELWANRNGCDEMPTSEDLPNTVEADNSTVTLLEYDNCTNDSEVLFYQIDGGGHNWSGGPLPFSLPFLASVNQDINASVEIWNFFNRHTLTRTATSTTETLTATDFRVFPNPFTESFTVELDLPESQAVQLQLLNVLGQPVSEIVNQKLPAGQQLIQWNLPSANLPAGVYYLHLTMNQQSFVRSVVYEAN
ncbi:MAG: PHB depolymerase family esterase [Bacteroidota bacterium]